MKLKNKALFLDRDGVINKNFGYVFSMKNFIWLKNVKKAIKKWNIDQNKGKKYLEKLKIVQSIYRVKFSG